ncbi:unnamed protein product [Linum trigynum]|uniref:Retrotransposon gag domain-containing protein n=1 Tax=Linum trigynum TaxID=586398 RepID=A0AAV2ECS9_9ROSI
MRIALKTKKKLGFINGTLPMPEETDPDYEAWDQSNTNVMGWILNSLLDSIAEAVMDNETAQDLWKDLQERYGEADSIRLAHVKGLIANCKQGDNNVTEYYNRLGVLWTEYLSFKSIPACECSGTPHTMSCATYAAVKESQEQDHTIDFIIGLSDSFELTKNQLLLMDPAPSLKLAYKHDLKLERQMGKQPTKEATGVDSVALAAMNSNKGKDQRPDYPRGNRTSTYQGNYPGNSNPRSNNDSTSNNQQGLFCNYCKKTNHNIVDCWKLKRKRGEMPGQAYAAAATNSSGPSEQVSDNPSGDNEHTYKPSNTTTLRLAADDCNRLMMLLQQTTGSHQSQPAIQPQAHSASRHLTPMPNNAGPSFTEEDWFCKRG